MTIQHILLAGLYFGLLLTFVFGGYHVQKYGNDRLWAFIPFFVLFLIYMVWALTPGPMIPFSFK